MRKLTPSSTSTSTSTSTLLPYLWFLLIALLPIDLMAQGMIYIPPSNGGGGGGTVTNSGTLTANAIVSGNGGVNITTPNTNATIDSSGNIVTPGTISGGTSGTAGSIKFYDSGGTNFTGWSAPTSLSGGCLLDIPAGDPAGQVLQFAAPSGGHCAGSWISAGGGASPYNPVSSVTWSTYGSTFTSITTTGSSFLVNETMTSVGSTPWFGQYYQ